MPLITPRRFALLRGTFFYHDYLESGTCVTGRIGMKATRACSVVMVILSIIIYGCSGETMDPKNKAFTSIKEVPEATWKKLSEKRIYFGHQSVGYNIIDGVKDVMKENPKINLNIVETNKPADHKGPIFAHSPMGQNFNSKSKCEDFEAVVRQNMGEKADIAFFKFCFVDFDDKTDVNAVFEEYKRVLAGLKHKYPQTVFIHVTVPLTTPPPGFKATVKQFIKQLIGRPIMRLEDNISAEEFNEKLRKEYAGKEALFDLAKVESTAPDGTRAVFQKGGKVYNSMVPAYTDDGGHLNETGRKVVAEQLLIFLANLSN